MSTILEEFHKLKTLLSTRYDDREAGNIARYALEDLFGIAHAHLPSKNELPENQRASWENACERLMAGEPLQYITGKAFFYGLELKVAPSVLIPRPETEELVEWILFDVQKKGNLSILDIGTGSGCIPIAIKKNAPNAQVSATDISEEAILIARENAKLCDTDISFFKHDILNEPIPGQWDIIVSNPPYIGLSESQTLAEHVVGHEPHIALFAPGEDPMIFYRKIAEKAKSALNPGGAIYVEVNANMAKQTLYIFQEAGYSDVDMKRDLDGKWRMICCKL